MKYKERTFQQKKLVTSEVKRAYRDETLIHLP